MDATSRGGGMKIGGGPPDHADTNTTISSASAGQKREILTIS